MKRFLAIILAGLMLLSFAACSAEKKNDVEKIGIHAAGMAADLGSEHHAHYREKSTFENSEIITYDNLSSLLLGLENGNLSFIYLEESTANYVAARNDKLSVVVDDKKNDFAMMTLDSNQEIYDILNDAIKEMKADGTLDKLVENELKAYITSDPEVKDLPKFDGAKTIKVGITGDIPPMDFVAANGKAAGFNIALLTEIANRAQVNIELVQIETGSRPMALSSGKVDVVFWTRSVTCPVCDGQQIEKVDGTLVTESYFSDSAASVRLKSDK